MSYGLNLYGSGGGLVWSSDDYGIVVRDTIVFDIYTSNGTTWSYPDLVGATISLTGATINASMYLSISYPGGVPTVTYTAPGGGSVWVGPIAAIAHVLVDARPGDLDPYGLMVFNGSAKLALDDYADQHVYLGAYSTTAWFTNECCCGLAVALLAYERGWRATIPKSVCPTAPLAFVDLPDYPEVRAIGSIFSDADNWYIVVYSTTANPFVYVFRRTSQDSPGGASGYGLRVYKADGSVCVASDHHKLLALKHRIIKPDISELLTSGSSNYGSYPSVSYADQVYVVQDPLPSAAMIASPGRLLRGLCSSDFCKVGSVVCKYQHYGWSRSGGNLRFSGFVDYACPSCTTECSDPYEYYGWQGDVFTTQTTWRDALMIADKGVYA